MTHRSLRLVAAFFVLGRATTQQLVDAANDALSDGIYSYSLGELYSFRNPTWGDCAPLFVAAMQELEATIPDPATAVMALLEFHVLRLVEGTASPDEVVYELYRLGHDSWDCRNLPVEIPPTALDPLDPFIDLYYDLDESHGWRAYQAEQGRPLPEHDEHLSNIRTSVLSLADEWCRNRWATKMSSAWRTSDVVALARGVAADKAFNQLTILADALQDAGCDNEYFLDHLRNDKPHARCCFVVDLLLGLNARGVE